MGDNAVKPDFQESKIEEEPLLGKVLRMPDGRIQTLTFTERLLAMVGLKDAKALESKYSRQPKR
jgi:hypothetical protein